MVKRWELKKREIELKWVLLEFVMSAKYKYDKIPMLTKKNTIILLTEPFKLLIHLQTHFEISQLLNLGKNTELKKKRAVTWSSAHFVLNQNVCFHSNNRQRFV